MAPINIWMGRSKEPLTPFLAVILAIFAIVALIVLMCVPFALSALYQEFKDWRACRRSQNAHTFWLSSHANDRDSTDSPPSRLSSPGTGIPMDRLSRDEVPDDLCLPVLYQPLPAAHLSSR